MKVIDGPAPTQKGVILPLVAVCIFLLLGVGGLAVDFGRAYVNKTRLQNAVDAAALSTAISVWNNGVVGATTPIADGRQTFTQFAAAPGNADLQLINVNAQLQINFWSAAGDPVPGSTWQANANPNTRLVRARVAAMDTNTWLMRVFNFNIITVGATAVAGPQGISCTGPASCGGPGPCACAPNNPPSPNRFATPGDPTIPIQDLSPPGNNGMPNPPGTQIRFVLFKDPDGPDA